MFFILRSICKFINWQMCTFKVNVYIYYLPFVDLMQVLSEIRKSGVETLSKIDLNIDSSQVLCTRVKVKTRQMN